MIGTILRVVAVVVFALLAAQVIDTNVFRWEMGGLALGFASLLPWPN